MTSDLKDWIKEACFEHWGAKAISIVIAVVLWVAVLWSRVVEVTKDVPLEVITSKDLILSSDVPDRITYKLSGPKAFLRSIVDRQMEPIRINLTGQKAGTLTQRLFPDDIRLPIGVKIIGIQPSQLQFKLEALKTKDIPVKLELRGTAPEGYRVVKLEVRPSTVRIKGAEERVADAKEVPTQPVDLSDLRGPTERELTLDFSRTGVALDGKTPRLYADIRPVSANYRLRNLEVKVITGLRARISRKAVDVWVRMDATRTSNLDQSDVSVFVDLKAKPKGAYPQESVKVNLPPNVGLVRIVPDRVDVTLY